MALVNKRITELPERSALNLDDFTVVDGDTGGTAKYNLGQMDDDISDLKTAINKKPEIKDSLTNDVDLDVSDNNGNVLLRVKNGHLQTKNFTSETIEDRTTYVTVNASGGGDYTTLRGAIDYISSQGNADPVEHPYVIKIYPGIYNVLSDYTQAEIETADVQDYHNGFVGPYLSDGVSLIGVGAKDSIVLYGYLDPEQYNSRIRGNISALNLEGNVSLENLTIIAKRLRYCVHDDFRYAYDDRQYNRLVKNCKFIGESLSHKPPSTWGGGMSKKGMNALFENCDFGTDFGLHGTSPMWSTKTVLRNCRGRKVRLSERDKTNYHYVILENCNFEMISLMDSSETHTQNIFIEANGCEKTYVSCYTNDIIITGAITKTPLTNLPIGTMVRKKTTSGNEYQSTNDKGTADGIIIANDDYYSYVQRTGYINTRILGITGYSLGDYITIDGNNKLTTGGTESNAVGEITFISNDSDSTDQGMGFIKLFVGGME